MSVNNDDNKPKCSIVLRADDGSQWKSEQYAYETPHDFATLLMGQTVQYVNVETGERIAVDPATVGWLNIWSRVLRALASPVAPPDVNACFFRYFESPVLQLEEQLDDNDVPLHDEQLFYLRPEELRAAPAPDFQCQWIHSFTPDELAAQLWTPSDDWQLLFTV